MIKRLLICVLVASSLVGCSNNSELTELKNIQGVGAESSVTENYRLSYTDEQSMIYSQVSDRTLLDLSTLSTCSESELQQVLTYMDNVDSQLVGGTDIAAGVIDECFVNYLLAEFEKTPYYWQRTNTIVRGVDPSSRSIVVDVKYKTIGFDKTLQLKSPLVLGESDYEKKMETRLTRWINILSNKYNNYTSLDWQSSYDEFVRVYGDPEEIYLSQSNNSLMDTVYKTGNQKTYEGLKDNSAEQSSATMTVRYVLVPNYVLGINLGVTCQHLYVIDYKLGNDVTSGLTIFKDEGYTTVTDSVYKLIYSYFQCIDECDYTGLYNLTTNFGSIDRYFEDMFDTSYRKHENFTISLFNITGTHISSGVTISSKIRAKGSSMTFPSYTDRYYFELELIDGVLQVQDMVLLSRTIEGEPTITTDDAEATGFASAIELTNDDRLAIEDLICKFGALQLEGDTGSINFAQVVDLSMAMSSMTKIQEAMTSLTGVRKATWISNYQQGTSNYASVKCRELFQSADNGVVEATVVYDFILKGGKWYVYEYKITSSVKLDTTNLNTKGSLCLVSPGKVESYSSQLKGTASTSEGVSDISVAYDHAEYTPVLKTGIVEQGLNKDEGYNLSEEVYVDYLGRLIESAQANTSVEDLNAINSLITEKVETIPDSGVSTSEDISRECVGIYFNIINNRYLDGEKNRAVNELESKFTTARAVWTQLGADSSREEQESISKASETIVKVLSALRRG